MYLATCIQSFEKSDDNRTLNYRVAPFQHFPYLILLILLLVISSNITAQDSHLDFRFSNGKVDRVSNSYSIDVDVKTQITDAALYAMNLRFFYEADLLKLAEFSNFKDGYNFIDNQKKTILGSEESAERMFGLQGTAGYVNQGIEMKDVDKSAWKSDEWEKVVTLRFEILDQSFLKTPCPSFMWDKQSDTNKGGLLRGSMGSTASFIGLNNNKLECNGASCSYEDYNWLMKSVSAPYGESQKGGCIAQYAENKQEVSIVEEVILEQNSPNPFAIATQIGFSIPKADNVTITIYDLKGVVVHTITDHYDAGTHTLLLDKSTDLPNGTLMYQLETSDTKSEFKKMVKFQ